MVRTDCVCSGAHCAAVCGFAALRMRRPLYGERAPCEGPFNRARALVHRGTPLTCHSEERSDVGISCRQLRFRRWLSHNSAGYCEIATAPLGPRNDNSKPLHVRRCRSTTCDCQRRLLSAATDAIGFHVLSPALYELQVPSRDCHVGRWPPRNDKSEAFAILTVACTDCKCVAGRGMPLPYNGGYRETAACFLRRCCAGRGKPLPYNASSMPRPCEITCVHPASAG